MIFLQIEKYLNASLNNNKKSKILLLQNYWKYALLFLASSAFAGPNKNYEFNSNCEVMLDLTSTDLNLKQTISINGISTSTITKHIMVSTNSNRGSVNIQNNNKDYSFVYYSLIPPTTAFKSPMSSNESTDEPSISEKYKGDIYLSLGGGMNNEVCTYKYSYSSNGTVISRGIPIVYKRLSPNKIAKN